MFSGIEVYMPVAGNLFLVNTLILEESNIWASVLAVKVPSSTLSILVLMFSVFIFLEIN